MGDESVKESVCVHKNENEMKVVRSCVRAYIEWKSLRKRRKLGIHIASLRLRLWPHFLLGRL